MLTAANPSRKTFTFNTRRKKIPVEIMNKDLYLLIVLRVALIKKITWSRFKDDNLIKSKWKNLVNKID